MSVEVLEKSNSVDLRKICDFFGVEWGATSCLVLDNGDKAELIFGDLHVELFSYGGCGFRADVYATVPRGKMSTDSPVQFSACLKPVAEVLLLKWRFVRLGITVLELVITDIVGGAINIKWTSEKIFNMRVNDVRSRLHEEQRQIAIKEYEDRGR